MQSPFRQIPSTSPRQRHQSLAGVLAILVLLALTACGSGPRLAPDVEFIHLDGSRSQMADYRGQAVLVLFWATNCPICLQEQADYVALYGDWQPRGLAIVAVAMPYDPPNRVLNWVRDSAVPFPVALDVQGRVLNAFGDVPGTPTSYLIGAGGEILQRRVGAMDFVDLKQRLERILPAPETQGS